MFATFNSSMDSRWPPDRASTTKRSTGRLKRHQVARACSSCRLNRIKCDKNLPCRNCQQRRLSCSNDRFKDAAGTLPAAKSRIEKLESRNRELESELKSRNRELRDKLEKSTSKDVPSETLNSLSWISSTVNVGDLQPKRWQWQGVWENDVQTNQVLCYGPSSSVYLIHRMRSYLKELLQQSNVDDVFQPVTSGGRFTTSSNVSASGSPESSSSMNESIAIGKNMSRSQEEQFLNLFWKSYHFVTPLLNEKEFKEYYDSLWTDAFSPNRAMRRPSALVDSILALCVQYGMALIVEDQADANVGRDTISLAGRWLYHRSRNLLSNESETPTIFNVQCLIYLALYLNNVAMLDMVHQTLAVAIRVAYALGLQHEAAYKSSFAQCSLRRRIWWTLYLLDSKTSMELGRPYLIDASSMTCNLPSDDLSEAKYFGSASPGVFADVSWLAFHTQCIKLIVMVRSISTDFYDKCSEVITAHGGKDLYENHELLESCAGHLLQRMKGLQEWIHDVPDTLKNARRGSGEAFSTAHSLIEIDTYVPPWVQRQRILLELSYHNLTMILHRPFIRFPPGSSMGFQMSAGHSISCLSHAIITTSIIHQLLNEVDILNGWQQIYQFQWDATLSILGFGLAHPVCPHAPAARRSLHIAIANLDALATANCLNASNAAAVVRNFLNKIDFLSGIRSSGPSLGLSSFPAHSRPPSQRSSANPSNRLLPQHLQDPSSSQNQLLHFGGDASQIPNSNYPQTAQQAATGAATTTTSSLPPGQNLRSPPPFFGGGLNSLSATAPSPLPMTAPGFPMDIFDGASFDGTVSWVPNQELVGAASGLDSWLGWDNMAQEHGDPNHIFSNQDVA